MVSDGSYDANFIAATGNVMPAAVASETVAEYCKRLGIVENDYYTLVGFYIRSNNVSFTVDGYESVVYAKQFPCNFVYIRMKVKAGILANTDPISNLGQVLVIDDMTAGLSVSDLSVITPGTAVTMVALGISAATKGASGIIRSEKNNDLRSQCTLEFTADKSFGLASEFALVAWQQGSQELGDSSLILEGRESGLTINTDASDSGTTGGNTGGNTGGGSSSGVQTIAAPVISGETPFAESTTVSMSGPDGAEIHYTTDGSTPTAESQLYSEPFTLNDSANVKAIAIKDGNSSQVSTKAFTKGSGGVPDDDGGYNND
jgi:hypothetical protein